MGTCCAAHLPAKIREYAPNAENGSITVTPLENPQITTTDRGDGLTSTLIRTISCDYCKAPAEFVVSYYPRKT